MKYNILIDYGSEGHKFYCDQFDSVDEAVKKAITEAYGNRFLIVRVIDWKAEGDSSYED